ncbi:MAG: hypothetical protein ACI8QC_001528 [Planctomycetota bacterium]|jgi:hypothetical protein
MMDFLKGFNLARLIIVVCLIGSGVLGMQVFERQQMISDYREKLGLDDTGQFVPPTAGVISGDSWVAKKVRSIQQLGQDFTSRMEELEGEGLKGQGSPQTYIRSIANKPRVALGGLSIQPRTQKQRGYDDNKYTIVPTSDDQSRDKPTFQRTQIANFLYSLEQGSRKIKVTALDIHPPGSRDFETFPSDRWEFTCEVTERVETK